jgi:hypothetical protein
MHRNTDDDFRASMLARRVQPASNAETIFRHSGWSVRRSKVLAALNRAGASEMTIDRFEECGSDCAVEWSATEQRHRVRANYCHNRHCEPCQRSKANLMASNLRARLGERPAGRYRFVTLTLNADGKSLLERVKRLYTSWRNLRKTKMFRESQHGGVAMLEVKLNSRDPESGIFNWHCHLHLVTEGGWLDQNQLSHAWFKVTGDSYIVHVTAVSDPRGASAYLTKYVTKGTSPAVWDDVELATEWMVAMRGVRSAATFGSWRGFKLLAKPKSATDWVFVGTLDQLISRARAGSDADARTLMALRRPNDFDFDLHTAQ